MRSLLIVAALVLAAGCDDPAVRDRIDSVLDHGSVQAEALCDIPLYTLHYSCSSFQLKADLLQDSASIVRLGNITSFNKRGDSVQHCDALPPYGGTCVTLIGGDVEFDGFCQGNPYTGGFDIDTYCTGFNLEAFD